MLTAAQCATVAHVTEDGDFLCDDCAGSEYTKGVSQYEMDEYDAERSSEYLRYYDDDQRHAEYCACTLGVTCDGCDDYIIEPYDDIQCEEDE